MKLPKHFAMQLYNRQISKQPGINVFDTFMFQSLFNNNVKTPASIMSIGKLLLMKCHRVKKPTYKCVNNYTSKCTLYTISVHPMMSNCTGGTDVGDRSQPVSTTVHAIDLSYDPPSVPSETRRHIMYPSLVNIYVF